MISISNVFPMAIVRSVFIWICFVPAAILNGGLREHVLNGILGERLALPLSGILLSGFIFLITWFLFPRMGAFSKKDCFKTGLLWMFMTVLFEFASGLAQGCAFAELLAAYNPATGNLWILVMLSTLLSPVIAGMKKAERLECKPQAPVGLFVGKQCPAILLHPFCLSGRFGDPFLPFLWNKKRDACSDMAVSRF